MTANDRKRRKRWMWRGAGIGALIAMGIMVLLAGFVLLFDPSTRQPASLSGWLLALLLPALFGLPFGLVIGIVLGLYASMMWRPRDADSGEHRQPDANP